MQDEIEMTLVKAPRDSQRGKVYDWESRCILKHLPGDRDLSLDVLGNLIQCAYARYGFEYIKSQQLSDGRGRRTACFTCSGMGIIKLPRWARSRWVALHEAAHGINWLKHNKDHTKYEGHGPEFMKIYIDLIDTFLTVDSNLLNAIELRKSAAADRVRVG